MSQLTPSSRWEWVRTYMAEGEATIVCFWGLISIVHVQYIEVWCYYKDHTLPLVWSCFPLPWHQNGNQDLELQYETDTVNPIKESLWKKETESGRIKKAAEMPILQSICPLHRRGPKSRTASKAKSQCFRCRFWTEWNFFSVKVFLSRLVALRLKFFL